MADRQFHTLVIGSGPAGLAIAGQLKRAGIPFHIVEKSNRIANSWHEHYDRLHLHTVKRLSELPFERFPDQYPKYVPKEKLIAYYENYAKNYGIEPELGVEIVKIARNEDAWVAVSERGDSYHCKNVIIATGVNRRPKPADWPGIKNFTGRIIHSSGYKNPEPFKCQCVLVVGLGNSGAEIALDLAQNNIPTFASVRGALSIVPRDLNGRSVQETSRLLARLPFGLGDWIGNLIRKIYIGDLSQYGIISDKTAPAKLLRKTGKTPLIDIGTIQAIRDGKILVMPAIQRIEKDEVLFLDGRTLRPDTIINATGYLSDLEDLIPGIGEILDIRGLPRKSSPDGKFQGLHFIGFNNYALGGILGTIKDESGAVLSRLNS